MHFVQSTVAVIALLSHADSIFAASEDKKAKPKLAPCTIHSPNTGSYFDLSEISLVPPQPDSKPHKDQSTESWHARGYDYHSNFTLNICAPVLEELDDVVGVPKARWQNVSAFYESDAKVYSIGQQSSEPVFRGRKLVLNYTDGSPCSEPSSERRSLESRRVGKHEGEDDHGKAKAPKKGPVRRKSTLISLLCDRDPLAPKASVSFVGASPDECAYFFELRSRAACGGVRDAQQSISPGGVFGVIALVAVLVYLVGGYVYQRTVMHARGWRQLPNYSMWAGIAGFIRDVFVILTSSCGRLVPRSRGYRALSPSLPGIGGTNGGRARGGSNQAEDENRLIDQLDEEWDD
ncbi:MAG: Cation-independent mannose-6-phosphate receptor CI-MPR [Thelocarpon impressellum]|nr:MAG: Cation-independent mannose-6-phosphate receptor CI-MPR [Thelocarpon impressellum]